MPFRRSGTGKPAPGDDHPMTSTRLPGRPREIALDILERHSGVLRQHVRLAGSIRSALRPVVPHERRDHAFRKSVRLPDLVVGDTVRQLASVEPDEHGSEEVSAVALEWVLLADSRRKQDLPSSKSSRSSHPCLAAILRYPNPLHSLTRVWAAEPHRSVTSPAPLVRFVNLWDASNDNGTPQNSSSLSCDEPIQSGASHSDRSQAAAWPLGRQKRGNLVAVKAECQDRRGDPCSCPDPRRVRRRDLDRQHRRG